MTDQKHEHATAPRSTPPRTTAGGPPTYPTEEPEPGYSNDLAVPAPDPAPDAGARRPGHPGIEHPAHPIAPGGAPEHPAPPHVEPGR